MKKFIAVILLTFFVSANPCFAISELYYFKNIKTSEVEPLVNMGIKANNYRIIKQNPYYAVSDINNDYAVIILQQSGDNMFYYYKSEKTAKINRTILREIKKQGTVCEQSFNNNIISIYDDIAENLIKNAGNPSDYTFNDETSQTVTYTKQAEVNQKTLSGYIAQISAGTKFNVYLQNAINTSSASQGDSVVAVVQDGISYNGNIVIPQGSLVYGTLTKARSATYGSLNGKISINFNKIVTPDNFVYNIDTEKIDFAVSNEGKAGETVKSTASGAAVGAILGLLFGLLSDSGHAGRSAAIGAGIGAGSSLVFSAAEKGVDAEIPSFTELELTLKSPLSINVSR